MGAAVRSKPRRPCFPRSGPVPALASVTLSPLVPRLRQRSEKKVRLRPADPFQLIRWLARSQPDPRKAVAELVQNSLDAAARHVSVERRTIRGRRCLVVRDDGDGVLPTMERAAALDYLATHVGHSRKMGLDPAERAERVIAGKYGVGLLGFWALGRHLELRTRVAGSRTMALLLEEDSPRAEIVELAPRTDSPDTFTEAVVIDVHEAAERVLSGRRLSDYLAAELRGQLLAREVELTVHDHVARGLAQKLFHVVPRKFMGEPLDVPERVEVPGFSPIRVELHVARGLERAAIQVACAGTLVADDIAELGALELAHHPWVGRDLVGLFDFADFQVPPGTRRGVMPDAAASAFAAALATLQPIVEARLAALDDARREAVDRNVVKELRRALKGFRQRLPHYDLPHVEGRAQPDGAPDPGAAMAEETTSDGDAPAAPQIELLPPGPLARVRIVPPSLTIAPGGERRLRAIASDADGRRIADAELAWTLPTVDDDAIEIDPSGPRPAVRVHPDALLGRTIEVRVDATQGDANAYATATITIAAPEENDSASLGIPDPRLVSDPQGGWRSRMLGDVWEVNDAHEDYLALRDNAKSRLRYLLALLSKEIVLRTSGRADATDVLDSLVEVLAHAERNLTRE